MSKKATNAKAESPVKSAAVRRFYLPSVRATVEASSYEKALAKAEELKKGKAREEGDG